MAQELIFHYDGLFADLHQLPMRQLGKSLVGADRIINSGLVFLAYGRPPKRGERFELVLTAQEPKQGTVTIVAMLQQMPWVLPIIQDFLISGGIEAAYRFASYVLTRLGGRPNVADQHLQTLLQLNRDHLEARNRSEDQWRESLIETVRMLVPAARETVAPIGNGSRTLAIAGPPAEPPTEIDEPMADVIRSKEDDVVDDMREMTVEVDGIIHHSRQLKIKHPEIDGKFLTAEIRDPSFDDIPNAYTEAAAEMGSLKVLAKPVYREGSLHRLYIMDTVDQ